MYTNEKETSNPSIANIIKFLESDKNTLMQACYSAIRDDNNYRYFKNSIEELDNTEFDSYFPLVSTVIFTANRIECDSLNYIVSLQEGNALKKRRRAVYLFKDNDLNAPDAYLFKLNSSFILHLHSCKTGSYTVGGSADLVRYISANQWLNPTCIISFGICYGRDPEKQEIGDVLIPRKLYPWSIEQKIVGEKLSLKSDDFNFHLEDKFHDSGIYSALKSFCNGEEGKLVESSLMLGNCQNTVKKEYSFSVKVVQGNMSTGEAVISSGQFKKKISKATSIKKDIGGEMEGYGIAKECIFFSDIPFFIMKAICDWGENKDIDKILKEEVSIPGNLKDQLQAYAAFCAGIVLLKFLDGEKGQMLSLGITEYMGKGRNCIKQGEYKSDNFFIKKIKNYYKCTKEEAESVFALLKSNKYIVRSEQEYRINV